MKDTINAGISMLFPIVIWKDDVNIYSGRIILYLETLKFFVYEWS